MLGAVDEKAWGQHSDISGQRQRDRGSQQGCSRDFVVLEDQQIGHAESAGAVADDVQPPRVIRHWLP